MWVGVMVRGGRWGTSVWPAVVSAVLYGAYSYVLCLMTPLCVEQVKPHAVRLKVPKDCHKS